MKDRIEFTDWSKSRVVLGIVILLAGIAGSYLGYSRTDQTYLVAGLAGVVIGLVLIVTAKQVIKRDVGGIQVQADERRK